MALLGARLAERGSDYHAVFAALAALVGAPEELEDLRRQAATEGPDPTVVNMDQIWEEEAVTFLATGREACGGQSRSRGLENSRCGGAPRPGSTPQPARSY
jgi:nitrate reductase molybdenum cofactor assembly chaperone NarJ/NarW